MEEKKEKDVERLKRTQGGENDLGMVYTSKVGLCQRKQELRGLQTLLVGVRERSHNLHYTQNLCVTTSLGMSDHHPQMKLLTRKAITTSTHFK